MLQGTATLVTSQPLASVTDLSDVTSAGSGAIITPQERTALTTLQSTALTGTTLDIGTTQERVQIAKNIQVGVENTTGGSIYYPSTYSIQLVTSDTQLDRFL